MIGALELGGTVLVNLAPLLLVAMVPALAVLVFSRLRRRRARTDRD